MRTLNPQLVSVAKSLVRVVLAVGVCLLFFLLTLNAVMANHRLSLLEQARPVIVKVMVSPSPTASPSATLAPTRVMFPVRKVSVVPTLKK